MNPILYLSIFYVLQGMIIAISTWYTFTQYDDETWKERRPVTWEYLYLMIFIWPIFILAVFSDGHLRKKVIPFYRQHPKLALSVAAIVASISVILWSLLRMTG